MRRDVYNLLRTAGHAVSTEYCHHQKWWKRSRNYSDSFLALQFLFLWTGPPLPFSCFCLRLRLFQAFLSSGCLLTLALFFCHDLSILFDLIMLIVQCFIKRRSCLCELMDVFIFPLAVFSSRCVYIPCHFAVLHHSAPSKFGTSSFLPACDVASRWKQMMFMSVGRKGLSGVEIPLWWDEGVVLREIRIS